MKINERIKQIRKKWDLTQTEFGARIGLKGNTITGYENGTRKPSDSAINNICKTFEVNETWLRTGEGEMDIYVPDTLDSFTRFILELNCNNLEIKFLEAYFGLNEQERDAFCRILVKMFPKALSEIVGSAPLEKVWKEAPTILDGSNDDDSDDDDSEIYADAARKQRVLEKKPDVSASSAKEFDVG